MYYLRIKNKHCETSDHITRTDVRLGFCLYLLIQLVYVKICILDFAARALSVTSLKPSYLFILNNILLK